MPYITQRQSPAWKHMDPIFCNGSLWPNSSGVVGSLAAWYDSSNTASMLDGSGNPITAGGKVATWKDISGNSPVGERDLLQGTDANRPIYLPWSGVNYGYFHGVAGFTVSVPLANDTYDVAITYKDGTSDTSTVVVGAGVAAFGGTDAKFAGKMITSIVVTKTAVVQAIFSPSLYTSGATFTSSDALVWTVNGGAHIVTRTGLYFDGSNDYLKTAAFSLSQPETVYWTGEQVSWTANDKFYDGNSATERMVLLQPTVGATPEIDLYAGASPTSVINTFAVKTTGIISSVFNGANSSNRVNRTAALTVNAGTNSGNGFTLAASYLPNANGNVFVSELAIYSAAHDTTTQSRLALGFARKWRFSV